MEIWCTVFIWRIFFFSDNINLLITKTASQPFIFPRYARHFVTKRDFIRRHSLHIAYLKQPTKYISKRSSQQAGEDLFLNSEMPKKIRACPSINKSTEWHPLVPDYSPPLILTIANRCSFCSLQYDLSPPVGPLGCAEIKAAQYVFKLWNVFSFS